MTGREQSSPQPFLDHFSGHADLYARYRPTYPGELFAFLAEVAPSRRRAWDAATGNGQAACGLAAHFDEVVASDASASQVARARPGAGVRYVVSRAEAAPFADGSLDLVTVAQGLHWLHAENLFSEVRRVLRPGGEFAVWSYMRMESGFGLEAIMKGFYRGEIGPYWPAERVHVERGYADLPFPFDLVAAPEFVMRVTWVLPDLLGYLRSWSGVRRFVEAHGRDPVEAIIPDLTAAWGEPTTPREIRWPLALRVGRV